MYIATYLIDIIALIFLMVLLYSSTSLNHYRKRPFWMGIIITIIIILAEAGTVFADHDSFNLRSLHILCNVLGFALAPILPILITLILDRSSLKTHKFMLIPSIINIILTFLSPQLGLVFYVDANNQYIRGDFFFVFVTVYILNILFLVIRTLELGRNYNYPIIWKTIALCIFTIFGTSIQLINPLVNSSWHCITLSLFLYYLLMSEFDSSFDPLTGVYNRAAFEKAAKQIEGSKGFSVIILDINDFKSVNDTYGHDYGDTVLKTVAATIRKSFNKNYTCYRLGGDEFYIIGKETEQEKIENQLKIMTNNFAEMREEGNPLPTVSYGYSIFLGGENLDFHKNLKEADDQMYYYKNIHKAHGEKF